MAGLTPGSPTLITRINVVPIIDVSLVLVIILLVTAPLITVSDMPVNLPEVHSRGAEDERNLSITLGPEGEIAVDRDQVPYAELPRALRERLARPENAGVLVVVRADSASPYTRVGEILEIARAAGAEKLAIATKQSAVQRSRSLRRAAPAPEGPVDPQAASQSEAGR